MMDDFVLKRVGRCQGPMHATVGLESFVTRIGRHSVNDCCMDSVDLPCLVSRFHSAIIREETDGIIKYFVYDCKSLNGTFVNNVKIPAEKNILLKEGDILTFGCRGGDAVKVGGIATEEYAEFQYVFVRKSAANNINTSNILSMKTNHTALPKGRSKGVINFEKSTVQPHIASGFSTDATSHQLIKDHAGMTNDITKQTYSVKNALNNSTGHLTMPSEQRTPVIGSRKRKTAPNSATKSTTTPAVSLENGGAAKQQKLSESKGQLKTKPQQKLKRNTRKNLTYSDDELCSAFDCKRPRSETVSWVQCDDCDEWFHVDCVPTSQGNCDIEKLEEEEFHCGCV